MQLLRYLLSCSSICIVSPPFSTLTYPATCRSALLESQRLYRRLLVRSRQMRARSRICHRKRVVTAAAGDIKSLDVSNCGLDKWFLPAPIVARLSLLQELCCMDTSTDSKLRLPPAQVCSGSIEAIKKFFA